MNEKHVTDFISLADLPTSILWEWLRTARALKEEWRAGGNRPVLKGKILALVFQKPSLRTRVSFDVGMRQLGGEALYLSPQEIRLGERETIPDAARVLSGYVDGIMARVFSHEHILDLAKYATVPVINGLSDFNHPAQAFSDLFTLYEHWHWQDLRGRHLVFVGDGNNVARSLMFACSKVGMRMTVCTPPGYDPGEEVLTEAQTFARETGGEVRLMHEPGKAVEGADVIYTDVWASMGQEDEAEERRRIFRPYQVNQALLDATGNPDVLVMHCLPAHRGEEITDEVVDGPHSIVFPQAHNRLHGQKAILLELLG